MKNDIVEKWLEKLGIDASGVEAFLRPSYEAHMHDPFLMRDMEKATVRMFEAIEADEKVLVYTDYDCDGIPGGVIMTDLFEKIGFKNYEVHIPHREDDGYGLQKDVVEKAILDGVRLIITIDLGITAIDEVAFAMMNGVDVIVTDHHLPKDTLPAAFAILNPKADNYPEKMLCGSGVIFKFMQGFLKKYGEYYKVPAGFEKWSLDMAGLATIADMVPLLGENRVIAKYGLLVMRKARRPGLRELLNKFGVMYRRVTEDDIYFSVTPAINAASRMDDPKIAYRLLAAKTDDEAKSLAKELYDLNNSRKKLVATIMKDVYKRLDHREHGSVIVVGDPSWRSGILGLVAGKVADKYKKPTFVWGGESGADAFRGSVRSVGEINIVDIMNSCKDHFVTFGGHAQAGGFVVSRDRVPELEMHLSVAKDKQLANSSSDSIARKADYDISIKDINSSLMKTLESLAPFGVDNPKPLFAFSNAGIASVSMFGKEKEHLTVELEEEERNIKAIAFFPDEDFVKRYVSGNAASESIIGHIEMNYFRSEGEIRVRLVDI